MYLGFNGRDDLERCLKGLIAIKVLPTYANK